MNKRLIIGLVLTLTLGFGTLTTHAVTLKIGANPHPGGEVLEMVVPLLQEEGITLQIIEFSDYARLNLALLEGELDANFFQHIQYLNTFNEDAGANLVSIKEIFIAPMAVYSKKIKSLDELPDKAQISIPNDATNGGRALLLLEEAGLIKLDPAAGTAPTVYDLTENRLQIRFHELEAAQLSRSLDDVHAAVINCTYALQANLRSTKDAIWVEGANSPYVNVLVVRPGEENDPNLLKLAEAMVRDEIRTFILEHFDGAVVPTF